MPPFTPFHRGGAGPPLVCVHGFADTWRSWELVLPALERRHDVLAPTLPGHAGGPSLPAGVSDAVLVDALESAMDEAGFETAHVVGNSTGGYLALHLAARGRASSVVALAPGRGWATGDESFRDVLAHFERTHEQAKSAAPHVDAIVATTEGRRRITERTTSRFEHIPPDLLAHQVLGVARCEAIGPLVEYQLRARWSHSLDAERIECPVRIVWGTDDRILTWPTAAARYRDEWLPNADWVVLDGVGHCPQLDVPLETAELIIDFTTR